MATRKEVADGIHQVQKRAEVLASEMTDEQWGKPVHGGEHGWNVRQMFCHLAATGGALTNIITNGFSLPPNFNIDEANKAAVSEREGKRTLLIMAEIDSSYRDVQMALESASDESMNVMVKMPIGDQEMPLIDFLNFIGPMHGMMHLDEVERAIKA